MVSKLPFRGVPFNLRHMLSRENRRVETSLKCCMTFRTPSLVRLPLQNIEASAPTFLSGAAAKRGAKSHTTFPPRKDEIPISCGGKVVCLSAHRSRKGVKGPLVPCGVSFPSFPLCPKNASAGAMGFWLTERIQRAQRVGHSLVKESYPAEQINIWRLQWKESEGGILVIPPI